MALRFKLMAGSDLTLDRDNLTIQRVLMIRDSLPHVLAGDHFDYVASRVMAYVRTSYPIYQTDYGTLYWNSIRLHEDHYVQRYTATVTYSPWQKEVGTYQISVDQAVGTQHVTAGTVVGVYGLTPDDEVDDGGLIGFDGTEVKGCDIPVAEDRLTISFRHPQMFLNRNYIRKIGMLRGHPNNDAFLGYEPGEVMYMGGNFTETNTEASATYTFSISYNVTDLVVGGISGIVKSGWDVLSIRTRDDVYTNAGGKKVPIKKVTCVQVIECPGGMNWENYVPVFGWGAT